MRALILGTGVGLRTHLHPLIGALGARQVGIISRDPEKSRGLVTDTLGYLGSNLRTALEEWRPDLITVGLPNRLHLQVAEQLAQFDRTVLMEKPVGLNLEQCERISDVLSRAQTFINFQLRGLPPFRAMRDITLSGELGDIYFARVDERSEAFFNSPDDGWYFKPKEGGGQALAMLTHLVNLIQFLIQPTFSGNSTPRAKVQPTTRPEIEHSVGCSYQLGPALVELTSSAAAWGARSLFVEVIGSKARLEFVFSDGRGKCELFNRSGVRSLWKHNGNERSLFRIAFPSYLHSLLQEVFAKSHSGNDVNLLATLDDAKIVHRILALS